MTSTCTIPRSANCSRSPRAPTATAACGCRIPGRLAEILLAEDKGWSAEQVRGLLAQGGNNEVQLTKQIPVHVTYFTAVAGDGGQVSYFGDIYGHDSRMAAALGGKPLPPEVVGQQRRRRLREGRRAPAAESGRTSSRACSATDVATSSLALQPGA